MFLSSPRLGRHSRTSNDRVRRPRSFQASFDEVEARILLSSISAISWSSGGVEHNEVFVLGVDNEVWADKDSTGLVDLSGYLQQISAGLDANGNPEIYGIGGDNAVWVNHLDGGGWSSLGGNVTSISASTENTVFAIAPNNNVYVNSGLGWSNLGGYSTQISACSAANGSPEVYAIGSSNSTYLDKDNGSGWSDLGGYSTQISACSTSYGGPVVFAIGSSNAVYLNQNNGGGWSDLGGYLKQISASLNVFGEPEVFGIGGNNAAYVNTDNGAGWINMGGYVVEIAASNDNELYARGGDVSDIYSDSGFGFIFQGYMPLADPWSPVVSYTSAPAGVPLFSTTYGSQPSYLDVEQSGGNDCWLLASLAEVADRDPQVIENMFVYQGTGLDGGIPVSYYSVKFFTPNGTGFYVDVDTRLPLEGEFYDQVENDLGSQCLWVALAEKAYVEANAFGYVSTGEEDNGSYAALNNADSPTVALQAISGNVAVFSDFNDALTMSLIISGAWNAGDLVVLDTTTPTSSYIVGSHAYAVVGYNPSSSTPFELFNPWGTDSSGWAPSNSGPKYGLFWASAGFLSQNFVEEDIDVATANVHTLNEMGEVLTGSTLLKKGNVPASPGSNQTRLSRASWVDMEDLAAQGRDNVRPATVINQGLTLGSGDEDGLIVKLIHAPVKRTVVGAAGPKVAWPKR
jgi:hypothetical protein